MITLNQQDYLLTVTLDNPKQHNALGASDIAQLLQILADFNQDTNLRVLLLTGRGDKTFCAGASFTEMQQGTMSGALLETLTQALTEVKKPTICVLNGKAIGGGVEIATCCDFRLGVDNLTINIPPAKLGICYPYSGLQRYVATFGLDLAKRLLLGAETIHPAELENIGWFKPYTTGAALDKAAMALADKLASHAPLSMMAMKELLTGIALQQPNPKRAVELITVCESSRDLEEGLKAVQEKRSPVFTGH